MKSTIRGLLLGLLLATLLTSTAGAQTLTGDPVRLIAVGDMIDGETLSTVREGAVDLAGNVSSQPAGAGTGGLLVVTTNGVSTVIGRKGDTAPGGGLIEDINDHTEREDDLVLYVAQDVDDDIDNNDGEEILLLRDLNEADPTVLARTDVTLVPGRAVPFTDIEISQGFAMAAGRVAFAADFVDGDQGGGIYLWENGSLSTLVDTDDTFGGFPLESFNNAKPDKNGPGILFTARIDDGGGGVRSVFLYEEGNLTQLISEGQPFPGSASTIDGIRDPDIDGGRVAVRVDGSGGERGVFVVDALGNTTRVADLTTPLPDTPLNSGPATSFGTRVGIAGSLVHFNAARAVNEPEIWLWQDGTIEQAVMAGEQLDGFTVTADDNTVERHSISRNFITIIVEFADGPDALYRIPLVQPAVEPPPPAGAGARPIPIPWIGPVLAVLGLLLGWRALMHGRQATAIR